MADIFGRTKGFGQMTESSGGPCRFGLYGTTAFCSVENPRLQVWFVSNGHDFIVATHLCGAPPEPIEVAEAQQIAAGLVRRPQDAQATE